MTSRSSEGRPLGPSTLGIHGGAARGRPGDPVVPPLVQSATFLGGEAGGGAARARPGDPVVPPIVQSATFLGGEAGGGELLYSRYGNNPNQALLGRKIAELEGTDAGLALASGMGAMAMTLLALTRSGDHIVASRLLYGATVELLARELPRRGVSTTFVDPAERRLWKDALRDTTRVLLLELPTNPTLRVFDPRPIARLGEQRGITTVIDATFASPVNLRPATLGLDVIVHSATKYLGGHSDLVAGVVAGPEPLVAEVAGMMKLYGPALDPHAAWLLDRGLRTLDVRVRRQNENALALARWLAEQPAVERAIHPGLEDHPDHAVARDIMDGFGGMVSLVLKGGGEAADALFEGLELALVAPSLGGVETLVSQPRFTSHRGLSAAERAELGIPDGFVRVSVGVEDVEDLIGDFEQALASLP